MNMLTLSKFIKNYKKTSAEVFKHFDITTKETFVLAKVVYHLHRYLFKTADFISNSYKIVKN